MKSPLSLQAWLIIFVLLVVLSTIPAPAKEIGEKLVVHEWGTFTSLQDETGRSIGGINTNDEPVPSFVHRLAPNLLLLPTELPLAFYKGAPAGHPDVTMRLETPVIYFYPPAGKEVPPLDVKVRFHGGWLTEFYPAAHAKAPGIDADQPDREFPVPTSESQDGGGFNFGSLKADAVGELLWKGLRLNVPMDQTGIPQTSERVWVAPRQVSGIATVTTATNESEKYLFYRGVGHVDASLKVVRSADGRLAVDTFNKPMPRAWYVEIQPDGTGSFTSVWKQWGEWTQAAGPWVPLPAPASKHTAGAISELKTSMRQELVNAGLFEDEADAMLKTWEVSYFKSPGTRLFYIVPREVTDALLPLEISEPAEITRVMVGRIEILTPAQRELMGQIAQGPFLELDSLFAQASSQAAFNEVAAGKKPMEALGIDLPEVYANYLKLGRFRNALLLEEQRAHPSADLATFIRNNNLGAYQVPPSN